MFIQHFFHKFCLELVYSIDEFLETDFVSVFHINIFANILGFNETFTSYIIFIYKYANNLPSSFMFRQHFFHKFCLELIYSIDSSILFN